MELVTRQNADGTVTFFARCPKHNWFYKGRAPLTHGCADCWMTYYFSMHARTPDGEKGMALDMLERAIHHAAEQASKGEFDFKPYDRADVTIQADEDLPFEIEEEFDA